MKTITFFFSLLLLVRLSQAQELRSPSDIIKASKEISLIQLWRMAQSFGTTGPPLSSKMVILLDYS